MLNQKTNPVGLDWYIQALQTKMHTVLMDADHLNIADTGKYESYGRAYRNKTRDGYVAECYTASGEYKEVYWNDSLILLSFFGITGEIKSGVMNEAQVHLVFFADLSKLALQDSAGNVASHRTDEELRSMVQSVIGKNSHGFQLDSIELWLENVLREYPESRRDDRLAAVDMHPVHCFRLNLALRYDPKKHC